MEAAPAGSTSGDRALSALRHATSLAGAFVAVLACVALAEATQRDHATALALAAPAGASAVLVFAGSRSPFARPRNLLLGYLIAALVVIGVRPVLGAHLALASAACVSATSALMLLSRSVHPPAGGYALIPIVGASTARSDPPWAIVLTAVVGAVLILVVRLGVSGLDIGLAVGLDRLAQARSSR